MFQIPIGTITLIVKLGKYMVPKFHVPVAFTTGFAVRVVTAKLSVKELLFMETIIADMGKQSVQQQNWVASESVMHGKKLLRICRL